MNQALYAHMNNKRKMKKKKKKKPDLSNQGVTLEVTEVASTVHEIQNS
jgi:hypothetical protein